MKMNRIGKKKHHGFRCPNFRNDWLRHKKPPGNRQPGAQVPQFPPENEGGPSVTTNLFVRKRWLDWAFSSPASCPYGSFNNVDGSEIRPTTWHVQKPCKRRDILPINWCRISSINNMFADIPLLGMTFRKKHFKYTSDQFPQSLGRYLWNMASWCFQPFWKISITLDQFHLSLGVKMTKLFELPPPTCSSSFRENYY